MSEEEKRKSIAPTSSDRTAILLARTLLSLRVTK